MGLPVSRRREAKPSGKGYVLAASPCVRRACKHWADRLGLSLIARSGQLGVDSTGVTAVRFRGKVSQREKAADIFALLENTTQIPVFGWTSVI